MEYRTRIFQYKNNFEIKNHNKKIIGQCKLAVSNFPQFDQFPARLAAQPKVSARQIS